MTRKPDDWMPFNVRKYLGDTMHLTRDQHGAYLLLLMAYWMRGGPLPSNDNELAAIVRASKPEWQRLKPVLLPFFEVVDGTWRQKKAEKELTRAREIIEARTEAGRVGGLKSAAKRQANRQANVEANGEQIGQQNRTPLPLPIPSKNNLSSFRVGGVLRKGGRQIDMTPQNKLSLFQKWLADSMGPHGWQIVGKAADPDCEEYYEALEFCKNFAREHGKGWPHQWPAPQAAS